MAYAQSPRLQSSRRGFYSHRSRQSGAAIVTAILVVTIATLIVSSLFWREHVAVRSVENRLALAQTNWIERVILDWVRVVLRLDGATGQIDHLQETWAQGVPATKIDETFTGGSQIGDASRFAMVQGQMFDAQARLNLNNLLPTNAQEMRKASLDALRKLLEQSNLPTSLADTLSSRLALTVDVQAADGKLVPASRLPLVQVNDLRTVSGFDQGVINQLRDYVIFLPRPTPVNLNTASGPVIAAILPTVQREDAMRFVNQARREYATAAMALQKVKDGASPALASMVSINTSYFLVRGFVRYDRVDAQTETLIERTGSKVTVVWQQRS
jgi:general secretion pathway protein K